ncbi:hypothetical protein ACTD5D_40195 [Nocardia takedensis]|uniref:hypothetical protein n=1 Tax=Nocardia takedensis TaxID=259390 RepID=UPI003F767BF9
MVLFDVGGGLADMSMFTDVFADGYTEAAWSEFFDRIPDAKLVEPGRDLVCLVAELGYRIGYSTTFPAPTIPSIRGWLVANDFPDDVGLLYRQRQARCPAINVKLGHCRSVQLQNRRWLRGFIDDEASAVEQLRQHDMPGLGFDDLLGLRMRELRAELAGPARRRRATETPIDRL